MVCLRPRSCVSCTECRRVPCGSYLVFGVPNTSPRAHHPALISLHWLRVSERFSFKLTVSTYRVIHGIGLLHSCGTHAMPLRRRHGRQRSLCYEYLHVPLVRLSTVGSHTFPSSFWRPAGSCHISAIALVVFRWRFKTFLFSCFYPDSDIVICMIHKLSVFHTWVDLAITLLFRPHKNMMIMMMMMMMMINSCKFVDF